jgi:glycosyltransferase 2 family protein
VVARLRDGLRVAALPRTLAAAAFLSVAAWSCTVVAVLAVGQSLGIELTVGEGALLAAGTNLATAIPSGPGYLGTFEYAGKTIAAAFGLGASSGLALAILIHFLTLAVSSIGGAVALVRLGWTRKPSAAPAGSSAAPARPSAAEVPGSISPTARK